MNRRKTAAILRPLLFLAVCLGATSSVVADEICSRITDLYDERYLYCGTSEQVTKVENLADAGLRRESAIYAAENEVTEKIVAFALETGVTAMEADNHLNDTVCIPADFDQNNKLDHRPIIVIHGLFAPDLLNPPTCEDLRHRYTGSEVAQSDFLGLFKANMDPVPDFWDQHLTARIDWSSKDRLEKVMTKNVFPVFKRLSEESICKPKGCILITHSTGDLIASKWLDEGPEMLFAAGLENVNIVASFDFAGAAGGAEVADIVWDTLSVKDVATTLLGSFGFFTRFSETALEKISFTSLLSEFIFETDERLRREDTGIMQDLVINEARNNRYRDGNRVPRLRIVTAIEAPALFTSSKAIQLRTWANTFAAFANRPWDWWKIGQGSNDGIVSSHSACGATSIGGFTRCSRNLGFDGNREKKRGAAPQRLKPDHFPLLVSDLYHHEDIWADHYLGSSWLPWGKPARKLERRSELNHTGVDVDAASEKISPAAKVYQMIQSSGSE